MIDYLLVCIAAKELLKYSNLLIMTNLSRLGELLSSHMVHYNKLGNKNLQVLEHKNARFRILGHITR